MVHLMKHKEFVNLRKEIVEVPTR
ncbi:Protein of unknown function [Bacillus cytotoxicus]|uniref:Uncharacterized protein n=1 Tax=Bacillus cytotoxicus TaxID=580165 RepID=A0AAX2CDU5_9BACI|nr:Protein of unknown function [Bacillus cytotoxicus]